jgi:pyridoxamine--pyruvate transaminase
VNHWPQLSAASGPGETTNRTLRDHIRPMVNHYDPAFITLFARATELLKQVFQTRHDVVVLQGETVLGMEAVAASLFSPGDKVLNLVSGIFGKWFEQFVHRAGAQAIELGVPYNDAIDPDAVRRALRQHPDVKFLSVVHAETPSGTVNPIDAICPIAREFGVVTLVDTALGIGSHPLRTDAWGIDVAIAGPQKALGGVPGLCPIAVSPRAWEVMEQRTPHPLRESYLSLLDWRESWVTRQSFPYTPSVSLVYALESVAGQVIEVGLDRYIARHERIGRAARAGVRALGLQIWPVRDEIACNAVTTLQTPEGVQASALVTRMRDAYGVKISGGYRELAGKTFRLGHMGASAHPVPLAGLLAILERSLTDLGRRVALGAGVGAAMSVLGDWE